MKALLTQIDVGAEEQKVAPLRGLSFLDRFLVILIILAMVIGILLGNFVPSTAKALQRGTFVGVSIPIGTLPLTHPDLPIY